MTSRSMGFGSAEYVHTLVEAKKLAFEDRAKYYADTDFPMCPSKVDLQGICGKAAPTDFPDKADISARR